MPDFYFSPSNARVLLYREGGTAVWVDDACGVAYNVQAPMIPLFGYGDYRFTKVAKGREIVTGHLLLNYRYKNQLSFALLAPKQSKNPVTIENQQDWKSTAARAMEAFIKLTTLIKDPEARSGITNEYIDVEEKKYVFVSSKIDANRTAWVEWGQAKIEAGRLGVPEADLEDMSRVYKQILKEYADNGIAGSPSAIQLLRNPQDVLGDMDQYGLNVNLMDEVFTLIDRANNNVVAPTVSQQADRFKDSLWRRTRRSFDIAKQPPYHEKFSDEQQRYNLIVEFGHPDEFGTDRAPDHQLQIETLYFTGESMQVRVDDDDNLKAAFPFLAKQIT